MNMHAHPPLSAAFVEEPEYLLVVPFIAKGRRSLKRLALIGLAALLLSAAAFAAAVPAFGASGRLTLLQWLASGEESVSVDLPPPLPADLIAATRGEQALQHAEGQEAQAINASLPFSNAPLESARPFGFSAGGMTDHQRALHCLTQAVYYEAGFEPVEGRRAVAQVVLNRVRHPAFPNSVCGVVYDGSSRPGCQFSFTCDGSLSRPPAPAAWAAAERIAREALAGAVVPAVGLATHYHANYVAPYWAPRLTKLAEIGAHIFYRWPGAWGRPAAFNSRYTGLEAIGQTFQPDAIQASATLEVTQAPDPTDRRAPEDVGGRLDVTKGWTLSIPLPSETRSNLANATGRQASAVPDERPATQTASLDGAAR